MPDRPPSTGSDDPMVVQSIAVTVDDVVTALEATRRTDRTVVLRITPPFSARMRARIHVHTGREHPVPPEPVTVDPEALVTDAPPYPEPDRTADQLPDDAFDSPVVHHEHHVDAVADWRRTVRDSVVDAVDLETPAGSHRVRVTALG